MSKNFDFLEQDFPVLAQFGQKAEAYLYSDYNSCLMNLGIIGERIVNLMFTHDRITLSCYDGNAIYCCCYFDLYGSASAGIRPTALGLFFI